tara:strand:- start:5962 stop:6081 length:120 start_codon:yes stop_codon:yes gene_type:complete
MKLTRLWKATPKAIILNHDASGGDALMQFIESKKLGGYE